MDFTKFLARVCEDYDCPETVTTDGELLGYPPQGHIISKPTRKLLSRACCEDGQEAPEGQHRGIWNNRHSQRGTRYLVATLGHI